MTSMTLIIDNYDSFTFNLYQLFAEVENEAPLVVKNDQLSWAHLRDICPEKIVISPGPGRPENERDFGISRQVILEYSGPVLGVCLGLQGIGYYCGASVVHAPEPYHGRPSQVFHTGDGLFEGIPQGFTAIRYHSLMLGPRLSPELERTAWTTDGIVMGIQHRRRPLWAVQFHPESICTQHGRALATNFSRMANACVAQSGLRKRKTISLPLETRSNETVPAQAPLQVYFRKLAMPCQPVQAFRQLWPGDTPAFWLDSSLVDPRVSRFSFMGGGSSLRLIRGYTAERSILNSHEGREWTVQSEVLAFLERELERMRCPVQALPFDFQGGLVGYLGYELKSECGGGAIHRSPYPDTAFFVADRFIAFDHLEEAVYLVALDTAPNQAAAEKWFDDVENRLREASPALPSAVPEGPIAFTLEQPWDEYIESIRTAQAFLRDGESYEICLTNRLRARTGIDPLLLYLTLRSTNRAPYSAFLRLPDLAVVCSSPERFLKIDRERVVESRPIKGTIHRGATEYEDRSLAEWLRSSEKNRAENLMIVDLVRNDLGRIATIGSVCVPCLMAVETYATVHQLVSTVRAKLEPTASAIDCIRCTFPGGSMTGAPKQRTMELIDHLERSARGIYSGAIGFLAANGTADLNIVIRTGVFSRDEVCIGVGGAIVSLSQPEEEFEEMLLKARAILRAFELASGSPCVVKHADGVAIERLLSSAAAGGSTDDRS
jgi:para-aminobenzoate synthetase